MLKIQKLIYTITIIFYMRILFFFCFKFVTFKILYRKLQDYFCKTIMFG